MASLFSLKDSTVGIIGLGLMGGSLALALRGQCQALRGSDSDPEILDMACRAGIVDAADRDPARALAGADVIILATPVPAILALLEELPSLVPAACIVMDLGSTKSSVAAAMSGLPERFDPIGGHPLCGKEKLSLANAEADLFRAAPFLLTPLERTTPRALSAADQIIEAIGAKPVAVQAAEHDRILASTSHLPFLASCALSLAVPAAFADYTGPGFRSASRLAGTPSSMMLGVLQSNRKNVLEALDRLQAALSAMKTALAAEDFGKLQELLDQAQLQHRTLAP
ncbi:MAG: prephenate dehydrogenase [Bacteroidota bacterium]